MALTNEQKEMFLEALIVYLSSFPNPHDQGLAVIDLLLDTKANQSTFLKEKVEELKTKRNVTKDSLADGTIYEESRLDGEISNLDAVITELDKMTGVITP